MITFEEAGVHFRNDPRCHTKRLEILVHCQRQIPAKSMKCGSDPRISEWSIAAATCPPPHLPHVRPPPDLTGRCHISV